MLAAGSKAQANLKKGKGTLQRELRWHKAGKVRNKRGVKADSILIAEGYTNAGAWLSKALPRPTVYLQHLPKLDI